MVMQKQDSQTHWKIRRTPHAQGPDTTARNLIDLSQGVGEFFSLAGSQCFGTVARSAQLFVPCFRTGLVLSSISVPGIGVSAS